MCFFVHIKVHNYTVLPKKTISIHILVLTMNKKQNSTERKRRNHKRAVGEYRTLE